MTFQNSILAGTTLVREAIQSENYTPGEAGWVVSADGTAEFNSVTIRGGTVVSGTALYYDGPPAAGNLFLAIAAEAGVDEYGNAYGPGLTVGMPGHRQVQIIQDGMGGYIKLPLNLPEESAPGHVVARLFDSGTGIERLVTQLASGRQGSGGQANVMLWSESADGSRPATVDFLEYTGGVLGDTFFRSDSRQTQVLPLVPSANSTLYVQAPAGHTGSALRVRGDGGELSVDTSGVIGTYGGNAFTDYTPVVGGAGTATWAARTGWYQRVGKMVYVCLHLQVGTTAGSGSSMVTVTMPTPVYRGTRQTLTMHTESTGPNGSHIGNGECVFFGGGSGAVADRLRTSSNDGTNRDVNLTGADLLTGGLITIEGWYREA